MKCFRRYLSLLLCSVLLLVVFSAPVSAEEIAMPNYHVYHVFKSNIGAGGSFTSFLGDGEIQSGAKVYNDVPAGEQKHYYEMYFATDDDTILIPAGKDTRILVENIYWDVYCSAFVNAITESDPSQQYGTYIVSWFGVATDGTRFVENVTLTSTFKNDGSRDIEFSINSPKNLTQLCIMIQYKFTTYETSRVVVNVGEYNDTTKFYNLKLDVKSEEAGLLSGIWSSLTDGFNNMVNAFKEKIGDLQESTEQGFEDVKEGISGVLDAIIHLPETIWNWIENGLKSLFVPDEDYIADYKERWEELLSEKLGAVYQVINLTFESWDSIMNADQTNTIHLPDVSVKLAGVDFAFGDDDIQIVPDGFEPIVDTLKIIVGGLCTLAFINGLRKRYDEIMGVE